MSDSLPFTAGLVIACLVLLILLWFPDLLKKD